MTILRVMESFETEELLEIIIMKIDMHDSLRRWIASLKIAKEKEIKALMNKEFKVVKVSEIGTNANVL